VWADCTLGWAPKKPGLKLGDVVALNGDPTVLGAVVHAGPYGDEPFAIRLRCIDQVCDFINEDGTSPYNKNQWKLYEPKEN
jgi:hypothetical protein